MEYEFRQKEIQNLFRSIGSRYHLKIDISRYYSTIYTHIIPWALHTKIVAKRRQRDNSLYGNTIDKCIRNMQDAQTLGITIGPDTSAIIAEVIGTALDVEIQRVYTNDIKGFRQIDDFSLFFNDLSEAEKALSNVQSILKNYELEINVQKTKILPLPEQFIPEWKVDIRSFSFRDGNSVKKQNTDLLDYFSKTFKYCTLFPGDSVLKYALKRIRGETIHPDNWSIYESLILKSITSDPNCLETATEILKQYNDLGYDLNKERISECINEMLLFHSRFRDDHELSWTLYLAKSLGIRINGTLIKGLSFLENPIVILGLLDLRESSLLEDSLDTALWERFIRREECLRRTGS
ncbi:MAG: RNA-directed DNA polymerase [Deltaproteobacteria bacterium]|nr:RNA-directed DNA polymerase [Candidatus Zymogenaceae bacterium]